MGLFTRYDKPEAPREPEPATPAKPHASVGQAPKGPQKKSIPTPSRYQAEQNRRARLQPVLTKKQAKAREREASYRTRDEAMARMHAKPHNQLIRDWVDHRWNLAEFILPLILVVFVLTIVAGYIWPVFLYYSTFAIWAIFALLIVDVALMWFGLRKQLQTHFPDEPLKRKFSYAMQRALQMRRSRLPPARVKRGTTFVWPPAQQ